MNNGTLNNSHDQTNGHEDNGIDQDEDSDDGNDAFSELNVDHVPLASQLLKQVLERWDSPVNLLSSQTHQTLGNVVRDCQVSYSSQYAVLRAIITLGPEVVQQYLIPHVEEYLDGIRNKTEACKGRKGAKEILNVIEGTVLEAARAVLRHYEENEATDTVTGHLRLDTYQILAQHFGDALLLTTATKPSCCYPHDAKMEDLCRMRFRKLGTPTAFAGVKTPKRSKRESFSSSRKNFDYMADMGLPNDIFEPMDTSGENRTSSEETKQ